MAIYAPAVALEAVTGMSLDMIVCIIGGVATVYTAVVGVTCSIQMLRVDMNHRSQYMPSVFYALFKYSQSVYSHTQYSHMYPITQ